MTSISTTSLQSAQITMIPFQLRRLMGTSPIFRVSLACGTWATHAA
uniref:Alternative protein USP50 n=1 Tax=Homo sapiens TaxID=9606 RepID=L8EBI2_HUMAN|nr:alternative protein USP50 [Homo sapiens]